MNNDIRLLRDARDEYRSGNYGEALRLADEAKIERKNQVMWEIYTLQNSFKSFEVKKAADLLSAIIPILEKRQEYDSLEIIRRYETKMSASYFNDSASRLIAYISGRKNFPEADWIIGDVYKYDGEYELAKAYLLSAWHNAQLLDVSDEQYDILYSLADIAYIGKDMENYEADLLLIVSDDKYFRNVDLNDAMMLIMRSKKAGSMEKFFKLFRSDDSRSISAYFKLADYYNTDNKDKALKASALGVLTCFTKMYTAVKQRDPEFEYAQLSSLFEEIAKYTDIIDWAETNGVWTGFIDFAQRMNKDGDSSFSKDLYTVLAGYIPDEYCKKQAEHALKNFTQ
ncbi:MAG: hypothetical protein WCR31_07200 [Treponema sp.]